MMRDKGELWLCPPKYFWQYDAPGIPEYLELAKKAGITTIAVEARLSDYDPKTNTWKFDPLGIVDLAKGAGLKVLLRAWATPKDCPWLSEDLKLSRVDENSTLDKLIVDVGLNPWPMDAQYLVRFFGKGIRESGLLSKVDYLAFSYNSAMEIDMHHFAPWFNEYIVVNDYSGINLTLSSRFFSGLGGTSIPIGCMRGSVLLSQPGRHNTPLGYWESACYTADLFVPKKWWPTGITSFELWVETACQGLLDTKVECLAIEGINTEIPDSGDWKMAVRKVIEKGINLQIVHETARFKSLERDWPMYQEIVQEN